MSYYKLENYPIGEMILSRLFVVHVRALKTGISEQVVSQTVCGMRTD